MPENPPQAGQALAPARITSVMAVVSLVMGILGWSVIPVLGSVVAVVTGHMARADIRRIPSLEGDSMAVVGLVLGWSMLAVSMLGLLAMLAFLMFLFGVAALGPW